MWKVCWNKGRLCWKIAKLFYFCHLKMLVRPETFGPHYVPNFFSMVVTTRWQRIFASVISQNQMWEHCWRCQLLTSLPQAIRDFFIVLFVPKKKLHQSSTTLHCGLFAWLLLPWKRNNAFSFIVVGENVAVSSIKVFSVAMEKQQRAHFALFSSYKIILCCC